MRYKKNTADIPFSEWLIFYLSIYFLAIETCFIQFWNFLFMKTMRQVFLQAKLTAVEFFTSNGPQAIN